MFRPNIYIGAGRPGDIPDYIREITGVVDYINDRHHWFAVRYIASGTIQHECFKINEIGKSVKLK